jgi:hypothetical protein
MAERYAEVDPGQRESPSISLSCAPSVTHQAAEALATVDAAIAAIAGRDPHAGRQAVRALEAARNALAAVVEPVAKVDAPAPAARKVRP